MSPRATKFRDEAVRAILAVAAAMVVTKAANVFETSTAHKADLDAMGGKLNRVLDVVCELKPSARACSSAGDVKLDVRQP
jgi:hypothetical protein